MNNEQITRGIVAAAATNCILIVMGSSPCLEMLLFNEIRNKCQTLMNFNFYYYIRILLGFFEKPSSESKYEVNSPSSKFQGVKSNEGKESLDHGLSLLS